MKDELIPSIELEELCTEIVHSFPDHFEKVNLDEIVFCLSYPDFYDASKPKSIGGIYASASWISKFNFNVDKKYCVYVIADAWDLLFEEQRQWYLVHLLSQIAGNGSMYRPDLGKEFSFIVEAVGPYWRRKVELPNILDEDEPYIMPPLHPDFDDESSVILL